MEPLGITIFCDDIRFEQTNKITLVGCYGPEMLVIGEIPFPQPRLGMYVQLRLPAGSLSPSKIFVYFPWEEDEKPAVVVDISEPSAENVKISQEPASSDIIRLLATNVPILIGPLLIKSEGLIRVRVQCGDKIIKAGTLKIKRAEKLPTSPAPSPPA